MRIPTFDRFQKFMQVTAFFVFGMIVGSAVYNALKNEVVDQLIRENFELKDQLSSMKIDLEFAQQSRKENVINRISILFQPNPEKTKLDILTETGLKKQLKEDLEIFLGRSIYKIDTDAKFARVLLSKKIYEFEDNHYKVELDTMLVVDGSLQVWASAIKAPSS